MSLEIISANTILYCAKWRETVAFYRDQLQLQISLNRDWFVEFRLGPGQFLSVADVQKATIPAAAGAGLTISLQVGQLGLLKQQLESRCIECTPTETRWGGRVFYCQDPEGHRIEFWQPVSESAEESK